MPGTNDRRGASGERSSVCTNDHDIVYLLHSSPCIRPSTKTHMESFCPPTAATTAAVNLLGGVTDKKGAHVLSEDESVVICK